MPGCDKLEFSLRAGEPTSEPEINISDNIKGGLGSAGISTEVHPGPKYTGPVKEHE